jgi:hypothetical protein
MAYQEFSQIRMPIPWTGIQSTPLDQDLTDPGIPRLALIQSDRNQNDDPYLLTCDLIVSVHRLISDSD